MEKGERTGRREVRQVLGGQERLVCWGLAGVGRDGKDEPKFTGKKESNKWS